MGLEDIVFDALIDAGMSVDSSRSLAAHLSLHFPDHTCALLNYQPDEPLDVPEQPQEPPVEPEEPEVDPEPIEEPTEPENGSEAPETPQDPADEVDGV